MEAIAGFWEFLAGLWFDLANDGCIAVMNDELSYGMKGSVGECILAMRSSVASRLLTWISDGWATAAVSRLRADGAGWAQCWLVSLREPADGDGGFLPLIFLFFPAPEEVDKFIKINPLRCFLSNEDLQVDLEFFAALRGCLKPIHWLES